MVRVPREVLVPRAGALVAKETRVGAPAEWVPMAATAAWAAARAAAAAVPRREGTAVARAVEAATAVEAAVPRREGTEVAILVVAQRAHTPWQSVCGH